MAVQAIESRRRADGYSASVFELRQPTSAETPVDDRLELGEKAIAPVVELHLVPGTAERRATFAQPLGQALLAPSLRRSIFPNPFDLSA